MKYVYRMKKLNAGSDKFGPCECCGKDVETTYLLAEYTPYKRNDGTHSLTSLGCADKFGHKSCLSLHTELRMQ